jgi:hypothetical protein
MGRIRVCVFASGKGRVDDRFGEEETAAAAADAAQGILHHRSFVMINNPLDDEVLSSGETPLDGKGRDDDEKVRLDMGRRNRDAKKTKTTKQDQAFVQESLIIVARVVG